MNVPRTTATSVVVLPPPRETGALPLEKCLCARRSCRSFADEPLTLACAAQLLWAAQGVTGLGGLRTAPSAGAVYPLHTYCVAMNVAGLRAGAYSYDPDRHVVSLWKAGVLRAKLVEAAFDQSEVDTAALGILLTAAYGRSKREFGESGVRLALMEAGHAAQNVFLQATALSLGVIGLGRIDIPAMRRVLDLPEVEDPLYLLLAGRTAH